MKKGLKLFVWDGVLTDYSSGIMFALAPDVETARKMIYKQQPFDSVANDLKLEPTVHTGKACYIVWGGG